ncbi:MAG: hypothetical protein MZV70_77260 [Desulfobacterales bacterium]|nr:hypothetical protein [Desulfobacterales bacterium]
MQIICTVISADDVYNADVMAINAASAALCLSDMPFNEPVGAVRVGLVEGALRGFPSLSETEAGQMDLVVAGTENSIMMVEGGAWEIGEEILVKALLLAHEEIKKIVAMQKELCVKAGIQATTFAAPESEPNLAADVAAQVKDRIHDIEF